MKIVKSGLFVIIDLIDIYPMASRNGEPSGTDVILPQAFGIMV